MHNEIAHHLSGPPGSCKDPSQLPLLRGKKYKRDKKINSGSCSFVTAPAEHNKLTCCF